MKKISDFSSKKVFISCAACLTIYTETLKYLNIDYNDVNIVYFPEEADIIIVLGCQVTDLAIYNDLFIAEQYKFLYPDKEVYIGGCLAQREDIKLKFDRVDLFYNLKGIINNKSLVFWEIPFWHYNYENKKDLQGNIFRYDNNVQVTRGCTGNCTYCTIKKTRGKSAKVNLIIVETDFAKQVKDNYKSITIVADTLKYDEILIAANLAIKYNRKISLRNVEPQEFIKSKNIILNLANRNLLKIFHSPIQSLIKENLLSMNRNPEDVKYCLDLFSVLKQKGVIIATNIIIDYSENISDRYMFRELYDKYNFDNVAWNPYWNGIYHKEKAFERLSKYTSEKFYNKLMTNNFSIDY